MKPGSDARRELARRCRACKILLALFEPRGASESEKKKNNNQHCSVVVPGVHFG